MIKALQYLIVLMFILSASFVFAQKTSKLQGLSWSEDEPLNISSETMEFVPDQQEILFSGKVTIKQSGFTLTADKMTIVKEKGHFTLKAVGNVVIEHNGWYARSNNLEYKNSDKIFVFTGNPLVKSRGNVVKGKIIRYYSETNRIVVDKPETTMIISDLRKSPSESDSK